MDSLKVEILSRKLIKPSNPTPKHLQKLKLSLFDQLSPPIYVHILFYYLLDEDHKRAKNDERFHQMEKSLSQVLTKFYPLAGRFIKDELLIDCSDQGVEYFEAQPKAKLTEFLQEGPKIELLNKFLPWDFPPSAHLPSSPLLAIQINKFDCGGLVLGIRISHIIADACSMLTFINEWAKSNINQMDTKEVIAYCDHFLSLFPARELSGCKTPPPAKNPFKITTGQFLFDETVIAKIAEKADRSTSKGNFHPKRVVVVFALIWKALIGVSVNKHGQLRDSMVALAMNLRGKTALPISEPSYANFWTSVVVPLEAKKATMELQDLMILLEDSIKSTSEKHATACADDISSMLVESRREIIEKRYFCDGVDVYICTSWCRFPLYEVDFGWGKPYWISHASKAFEAIGLMDAKDGKGIEAWISLEEKDMTEFKRQMEILVSLPQQ